tara:strand:- start:127 stop:774 length:648 start_codon:yes stop_codon:yes gene_type:complete
MKVPIVIIMARWPAEKRCKSRLAQTIGYKNASRIQSKLTSHTISVARSIEEKGLARIILSVSGRGLKGSERWGKSLGIDNIQLQGKGSLGIKMRRQVLQAKKKLNSPFECKHSPVILIGTDLPNLESKDLIKPIEMLKNNEMIIGPSIDGGYWLIGFSGNLLNPIVSWPFSGISWGTNKVFSQTIRKAKKYKVSPIHLGIKNDIDKLEDLTPWQK